MKKFLSIFFIVGLMLDALTGCTGKTSKKLTNYSSDSPVVNAYFHIGDEYQKLPEEKLSKFIEMLNSMELKTHMGHVDYYWHGQFGIELELEDGTFIHYDGTCYELRSDSMKAGTDNEYKLDKAFIEVLNENFWDEVGKYFEFGNFVPYDGF